VGDCERGGLRRTVCESMDAAEKLFVRGVVACSEMVSAVGEAAVS
jgi:hypothetical protein